MTAITGFLLARIAEDEGEARRHVEAHLLSRPSMRGPRMDDEYSDMHVGPGRVLAECEAKRRILEEHVERRAPSLSSPGVIAEWCEGDDRGVPCPTLRAIAIPYADHPEYRQEWKP